MQYKIKSRIKVINSGELVYLYKKWRFLVWFFLGVISGTFLMNICSDYFYDKLGIYTSYFISNYKEIDVDKVELFWYSLKNMTIETLLIIALSFTGAGGIVLNLYCSYKGVIISVLLSAYVMRFGLGGVLVYMTTIFPHYVTYGIMIWILVLFCYAINSTTMEIKRVRCINNSKIDTLLNLIKQNFLDKRAAYAIIWISSLIIITAFLESFLSIKI